MTDYRINNIREFRWEFCDVPYLHEEEFDINKFTSDINFDIGVFDEHSIIQVFFHVRYSMKKKGKNKPIQVIHSDIDVDFYFENFEESFIKQDDNYKKSLLIQILGITISTARGIIHSNTKGHRVNSLILPILDPSQLFEMKLNEETDFLKSE